MKVTGIRFLPDAGSDPGSTLSRRKVAPAPAGPECVFELLTDDDPIGVGVVPRAACAPAERLLADLLIGEDPRGVTGLWQRMTEASSGRRAGYELLAAIAALDVALWDLKAKANGEPLWKALGGSRPRANVHAAASDPLSDSVALSAWYERMAREFGVHGGKLHLGPDVDSDVERLDALRTALRQTSNQPVLVIDLNQRGSPKQSAHRIRAREQGFDLAWVEGAARDWDFPGLKQVSDAVCCAVSVGRRLATPGDFLPHFHHRSADVIDIDPGLTGITGALQLADAAYGFELPTTLAATHGNIHAHLATVMPYFMSMEVIDPAFETPLCLTEVRLEDGYAIAGDAPGHGLTPRREVKEVSRPRSGGST